MVNYTDLLNLDRVRAILVAVDKLERSLGRVPAAFSGRQKPGKGPAPRAWYSSFVRDLAEVANKLGIEVTTAGDRSGEQADDPYNTAFTRLVFAVEKLLPHDVRSASLMACAKSIDRAIAVSVREIGESIERKQKRQKTRRSRLRDDK
jgi:hypothetical protein